MDPATGEVDLHPVDPLDCLQGFRDVFDARPTGHALNHQFNVLHRLLLEMRDLPLAISLRCGRSNAGKKPWRALCVAVIDLSELGTHLALLGDGEASVHHQQDGEHDQGQQRGPLQQEAQQRA